MILRMILRVCVCVCIICFSLSDVACKKRNDRRGVYILYKNMYVYRRAGPLNGNRLNRHRDLYTNTRIRVNVRHIRKHTHARTGGGVHVVSAKISYSNLPTRLQIRVPSVPPSRVYRIYRTYIYNM